MNEVIYADRVLVLHEGKVVFFVNPFSLFQKHNELLKIKLDLPFVLKIALGLAAKGCKIDPTFEEKNLIRQICQLL
jgi:ABC-type multidrug transport system ATPase subunit